MARILVVLATRGNDEESLEAAERLAEDIVIAGALEYTNGEGDVVSVPVSEVTIEA